MNKIAFIYPGQGAQKAGMGKDFYAYSPLAAEMYDKASEILNIDMKALCFEENDLLDQTEYTQAAMVTTCLAMTAVLEEAGLNPDVTAGLSLGEYCAIGGRRYDSGRCHSSCTQKGHPHAEYRAERRRCHGGSHRCRNRAD